VNLDKLNAPERALRQAFPRGELVDLTTRSPGRRAPTIRADLIAALLLGAVPPEPGKIAAIRLDGARITGTLKLGYALITGPVCLRQCEFEEAIDLSGAKTRNIDLEYSTLAGLVAPLVEIDGNLSIIDCTCTGQVTLTGAHIIGALRMGDSRIDNPGKVALAGNRLLIDDDLHAHRATFSGQVELGAAQVGGFVDLTGAIIRNEGGRALDAANMSVGARFLARDGFTADGEMRFAGTHIGGDLNLREAILSDHAGNALQAYGVQTGGSVVLTGARVQGSVRLSRAKVGGLLTFEGARLANPSEDAIRCRNTQARTLALGAGLETDGIVDLRQSQFMAIRDDPACWPRRLRLSSLSYATLEPPLSAAERVRWLRRDSDGYVPQNYETLAAMYRNLGNDDDARVVLLSGERARRAQLPWHGRAWSWLQEITDGYGYRPLRAAGWLAVFLGLGTLVFGLHHPPPLAGAPHPAFNPFIYTVDLLIPLVNLGMRNTYAPQGMQSWLAYFLIAAGWIFVTTIAAGILRVLRRQ
jgi:hypothetical protein